MTKVYYTKFCWNRECLYDGYIARKDNSKIFGCTDDSIILGNTKEFNEYISNQIIRYPIGEEAFLDENRFTGFEQYLDIDGNLVKLSIKEDMRRNEQYVVNRVMQIVGYFSESIQNIFVQNYLEED